MNRRTTLTMALLCLAIALPAGNAVAQQKLQVYFKVSPENSKFVQQQNVDVGDVPNHVVGVYEVFRAFPNDAPVINGLKLVEWWDRGNADYIDGNGPSTSSGVYVMENGDKFFTRSAVVVQSASGKLHVTAVGHIRYGKVRSNAGDGTRIRQR
jgi:hypothetical protein